GVAGVSPTRSVSEGSLADASGWYPLPAPRATTDPYNDGRPHGPGRLTGDPWGGGGMNSQEAAQAVREVVEGIKALRTPGTGCPWDLEQTHQTLRPYLVEEAHEVLDAIDRGDDRSLQEELGDLLLQVELHAQLADDRGVFAITEVARGITAKMVRRHP